MKTYNLNYENHSDDDLILIQGVKRGEEFIVEVSNVPGELLFEEITNYTSQGTSFIADNNLVITTRVVVDIHTAQDQLTHRYFLGDLFWVMIDNEQIYDHEMDFSSLEIEFLGESLFKLRFHVRIHNY